MEEDVGRRAMSEIFKEVSEQMRKHESKAIKQLFEIAGLAVSHEAVYTEEDVKEAIQDLQRRGYIIERITLDKSPLRTRFILSHYGHDVAIRDVELTLEAEREEAKR